MIHFQFFAILFTTFRDPKLEPNVVILAFVWEFEIQLSDKKGAEKKKALNKPDKEVPKPKSEKKSKSVTQPPIVEEEEEYIIVQAGTEDLDVDDDDKDSNGEDSSEEDSGKIRVFSETAFPKWHQQMLRVKFSTKFHFFSAEDIDDEDSDDDGIPDDGEQNFSSIFTHSMVEATTLNL